MPGIGSRALARILGSRFSGWAARALALAALASSVNAGADVTVLDAPNLNIVRAGQVETFAAMADGSAIVGGSFSSINGVARNAIAKIRADGTLDPDWHPSVGGHFHASVVDGAGNVYIGSDFALFKLDGSTGAIDPSFFAGVNGAVRALAIGSDGSLFAGGGFTSIGATPRSRLAKLDPATGALDTTWNIGADGTVYALAATSAGLYVGGDFATVGGAARKYLARVGTAAGAVTDSGWIPAARSVVRAFAPAASQIYVAGSQPSGVITQYLARYSTSGAGALDATWNPILNAPAYALALVSGAVYAGGDFSSVRSEAHAFVARIPTTGDGHADATWNPVLDGGARALAPSADGASIEVGGNFSRAGTALRLAAATLSTSDASLTGAVHDVETPGFVSKMTPQPDGGVVVGGSFDKVDQLRRANLFRLKPDRTLDAAWEANVHGSDIYALLAGADNAVYVAGPFTDINGVPRLGIAKLDGETGEVDPGWDAASNSTATSLAWAADGDLVVGGLFTTIGGQSRRYLAKLGPDASADPAWDPSPDNWVRTVARGPGDSVYVGGDFANIGSLARHYLAKIAGSGTGAADPAWSSAAGALVPYLASGPDGALYTQGVFDGSGDASHAKATKLDAVSGAVVAAWNLSPASISGSNTFAFDREGRVYVTGYFYAIDGQPAATTLVRASADTGVVDANWNVLVDAAAVAAVGADDTIYVGGNLTTIGGLSRQVIAAVTPEAIEGTVLTVSSIEPEPSHAGEPYTVSFHVDAPDGTPTGSVTISDDFGAGCGPVDLVDGEGSCEMTSAVMGTRMLTGLYASDSVVFNDATTEADHLVIAALTTIAITADTPDPSQVMDSFEIVAHVETTYPDIGAGPTGIVTFDDHAGFTCTADVDASGNASCDVLPMQAGVQTWTASYSGDGLYDASESAPETHTVSRRTVVMTLDDGSPTTVTTEPALFFVDFDQSNGIPAGSVTISDGTLSCDADIGVGFASCSLVFAHAGDREIVATYAGDDIWAPAESVPITHPVLPAPTAVLIRSHLPQPSVPGQPVTVTVDAMVLSPGNGVPTGTILVSGSAEPTACTIATPGGSCDIVFNGRGLDPFEADFVANDDFEFSVTTDLHQVNQLPIAVGDTYASFEDQPLVVGAGTGVLANDSDPDGNTLTIVDAGTQTASGIGGTVVLAADGSFTYTPPADANGKAGFTYTISDGLETTVGEVVLNVGAVNDPPVFTLAQNPVFAPGTTGAQTTPSFATMTSSGPGEDDSPLAWHVRVVSDPAGVLSAPATIALDGTLTSPLSGHGGTATLAVALQDDGGTDHGGNDTSAEQTFTISVGAGADLSVAIEDGTAFVGGGDAAGYLVTVRNAGPDAVSGAHVQVALSSNLVDATWTCIASAGASCAAQGSGEIHDTVDLPVGANVTYTLTATALADPEQPVEADATVAPPSGTVDFDPANDSASDVDAVGIFADGFDTPETQREDEAARAARTR